MKVFKAKLPLLSFNKMCSVDMPKGAIILDFQLQFGDPTLWFECDPDAEIVSRKIFISGTGFTIPSIRRYIRTIQDGHFVWHIYDCGESELIKKKN